MGGGHGSGRRSHEIEALRNSAQKFCRIWVRAEPMMGCGGRDTCSCAFRRVDSIQASAPGAAERPRRLRRARAGWSSRRSA